jgi:isopentenyldiphosphate isomerase
MTHAQDPDELFDIVTVVGEATGRRKRRGDVHRDGDWHRSIHIWVVGQHDGTDFLLLQRRSLAKDTAPGKLDPTVGGHLGAGETWQDGLREADEEIGLTVTEQDVVYAGTRRSIGAGEPGVSDQEIQDVFFVRNDAPLTEYRPNLAEIAGLVRMTVDDALELLSGNQDEARVQTLDAATLRVRQGTIARADFGVQLDRYVYRVAIAARQFLAGERHFSV